VRFLSKGRRQNNRGNRGGRDKIPNMTWKEGSNNNIRFSIHFDVDFEEFNQLIQINHLNLWTQPTLSQPFSLANVPLQPHPNIMEILEPLLHPMDDGWKNNLVNPPSGISHWLASPRNSPFPHVSTPIFNSVAFVVHSSPKDNKIPLPKIPGDKWNKPIKVLNIDTLQCISTQSKEEPVKTDYARRKIYFNYVTSPAAHRLGNATPEHSFMLWYDIVMFSSIHAKPRYARELLLFSHYTTYCEKTNIMLSYATYIFLIACN